MEVIWIVGIILWGVFAFWAMSVAESKGRAPWVGFLLGATLGIFGVIATWLLPTNRRVLWERQQRWENGER